MNVMRYLVHLRCWLLLFISVSLFAATVQADQQFDDQFPPADGTADQKVIQRYEKQLKDIQDELEKLNLPIPAELTLEDDNIACLLDSPYFAQVNSGRDRYRYLVGRLVVLNQSDKPLVVETENIRLFVNGKEHRVDKKEAPPRSISFQKNNRHYNFSELKPSEKIEIPAKQVASSWVVFRGLVAGNDVPNLTLRGKIGEQPFSLDASLQHRALLRWRREQIGPRGVIALCTIHGEVNTINMGTAIDDLITLATQNITRVVISFDEKAPEIDPHLAQWFQQITLFRRSSISEFPLIPAMIQEIHVANFSKAPSRKYSGSNETARIHKKTSDAIIAISQDAYEAIPVSELIKEIRSGNPLTQPAALIHGSPRLPDDFLPEVITLAQQDDRKLLRTAALISLGEFNNPRAVTALVESAHSEDESISQTALVSLGASRFPAQHEALMGLLKSPSDLQQRVVGVLTQFPRKRWADTLYQYVQTGPVSLRVESLKALNVVGHPELQKLLILLLQSNEETLLKASMEILILQEDRDSKKAVIDHALQRLENGFVDSQTLQMITRYKIHQAIPGLLALLKTENQYRSHIITTLSTIGNEQVLDTFIEIYPDLTQTQERISILQALRQIDPNRFLKFAPTALKSEETQIVSSVSNLLRDTATEEAVGILIEAIEQCENKDARLPYLISALGGISSPGSREYLVELRDSLSESNAQAARSALNNIYDRSPVQSLSKQANATAGSGNYALAIKQYTLAIEGDSYYPKAYKGRADMYKFLNENEKALADYSQLLKLDPQWPKAQGRMGQVLTAMARFEEAVESLGLAIEQEPEFDIWYSSRGHAYSMIENFEKAEADYRKALELDPKNLAAISGIALSLAINGKIDEAIKQIQLAHAEHGDDAVFAYNVACTYSRAAEFLQKKASDDPQDKKRIDQLIEKALDELDRAISLGYQDKKWTIADPDLIMLKEHQRFEKLLLKMGGEKQEKSGSSG